MSGLSGAGAAGRKKRRAVQPGQEQEEEGSPPPDEDPMRALVQYNQASSSFRDADFSQQFLGLLAREGHAPTPPHNSAADSGGADAPGAFSRGASGSLPGGSGGAWSPPDLGDVGSAFHGLNLRNHAPSSVTIAEHREAAGMPGADLGALLAQAQAAQPALPNGGGAPERLAALPDFEAAASAAQPSAPTPGFAGGQDGATMPLDDFALDMLSSASGDLPMGEDSAFWEQLLQQQPSGGGVSGPAFAHPAPAFAPLGPAGEVPPGGGGLSMAGVGASGQR